VVEGEHGGPLGIELAAVEPVADDGQGMGDLGHAQAVLLDVLRVGAVHQPQRRMNFILNRYAKKWLVARSVGDY
jgi:hypothetical protein